MCMCVVCVCVCVCACVRSLATSRVINSFSDFFTFFSYMSMLNSFRQEDKIDTDFLIIEYVSINQSNSFA